MFLNNLFADLNLDACEKIKLITVTLERESFLSLFSYPQFIFDSERSFTYTSHRSLEFTN